MKIKVLTEFLHNSQKYYAEEIRVVDDLTGDYFCRAGWAEDLDGVVPTAKPDKNEVVLLVNNVSHSKRVEGV